jgi:hypothetical protein
MSTLYAGSHGLCVVELAAPPSFRCERILDRRLGAAKEASEEPGPAGSAIPRTVRLDRLGCCLCYRRRRGVLVDLGC